MKTALSKGQFVVTTEFYPPKEANKNEVEKRALVLKDVVEAVVVRDNPLAQVHTSPIATATLLLNVGLAPIVQISIRDKNRLAIQSDILGAVTLGVKAFFCLEDCHQRVGDNPGAKGVFDLDCVQLISIMKKIEHSLVGTRINPFAHPLELHLVNLSKKINAGVDFIQTMPVFDLERFKEFISLIKGENLYLLAGVRPIKSWQALQSMSQMVIPENIVQRIKNSPENKQAEEGIKICVEIIKALKQIKGVNGIHIFAHDWEEAVPILVRQANLK